MTRTVVTGVGGRMGQVLLRLVSADPAMKLVQGTDRPGAPTIGRDVAEVGLQPGPLGIPVLDGLEKALSASPVDVVIDFTSAEASVAHARLCAERGVPLVVGSTGFSAEQKQALVQAGAQIPLVVAPNMSVGVNVVIETAARLARELGDDFDIEIVESHHRMKRDAPSGTALRIAEEIAAAVGRGSEHFRLSREGQVGERPPKEIGIQTLRGGDVVGEHTVFFYGDGERVELTHRATSRDQFGRGALRAAKWVVGRSPGVYGMREVLGLAR